MNSKILFGLVFVLAGCASSQRSARARWEDMHVDMAYTGELLKYTCGYHGKRCANSPIEGYSKESAAAATPSPPASTRQKPQRLKAYRIGRYVDQAGIVHEPRMVYRLESGPDWGSVARSVAQPVSRESDRTALAVGRSDQSSVSDSKVNELEQKIDVLEDALRHNTASVNANQTLLVGQINELKAQLAALQGKQASANPAQ
jgi:hypothetical protein